MKPAPAIAVLIAGACLAGAGLVALETGPAAAPAQLVATLAPIACWLKLAWARLAMRLGRA